MEFDALILNIALTNLTFELAEMEKNKVEINKNIRMFM
jgi:hypothetical protein